MSKLRLIPVAPRATQTGAPVPLDLAFMVPKKSNKFDALLLRIGTLPQGASLSAGRHNGDGAWTVSPEQLIGLSYFPARANFAPHRICVRVVGRNEDEAIVLNQVDFDITSGGNIAHAVAPEGGSGSIQKQPLLRFARGQSRPADIVGEPSLQEHIATLTTRLDDAETEIIDLKKIARSALARLTAIQNKAAEDIEPIKVQTGGGPRLPILAAASRA